MNGIGGNRDGGFVDLKRKATATARLDSVKCAEGDKKGEYDMVVVSRFDDRDRDRDRDSTAADDEDDFLDKYEGTFSRDKMCIEEKEGEGEGGAGGGAGGGVGSRAGREYESGSLSPLTPPRTSSGLIMGAGSDDNYDISHRALHALRTGTGAGGGAGGEDEGEEEGEGGDSMAVSRGNNSNSAYLAALALSSSRSVSLPNVITAPSTYAMYGMKIAAAKGK